MKRILLTCSGIPALGTYGGIISYVHELADTLAKSNYDVHVFVFREQGSEAKGNGKESYKYRLFELPRKRSEEKELTFRIIKEIETLRPDVIINNEIIYIQGIYPVIDNRIVKISVAHGFSRKKTMSIAGMQGKISTYNWQWTDWIVCQNKQMAKGLAEKYNVPDNRITAIDQTCRKQATAKTQPEETFTIVYAGGASKGKGSAEAYRICRKLSESDIDFKFIWCLDATRGIDRKLATDKRFVFAGRLGRDKFINTLNDADCIIIPSHMETGPMLLVEAMSTGTIPICNDIKYSAIPDIIIDGENGFKIENNNIDGYIKAINYLSGSRNRVSELKTRSLSFYNDNLTPECQKMQFERIFTKNPQNASVTCKISDKNIIHSTTHYKTYDLSKFSTVRLFSKIANFLEMIIDEKRYRKWGHIFLK